MISPGRAWSVTSLKSRARETINREHRRGLGVDRSGLGGKGRFERPSNDEIDDFLDIQIGDIEGAPRLAISQDGHPVRDRFDLMNAMRDVYHRAACGGGCANPAKKPINSVAIHVLGRFVQNEHARIERRRLDKLDKVLFRHRQAADASVGLRTRRPIAKGVRAPMRRDPGSASEPPTASRGSGFRDRQVRQQCGMLMHQRKAKRRGIGRGERRSTIAPSISTVPESGTRSPAATPISVDFPAPFSPTSACTSPERLSNDTPFQSDNAGKALYDVALRRSVTDEAARSDAISSLPGPAPPSFVVIPPFTLGPAFISFETVDMAAPLGARHEGSLVLLRKNRLQLVSRQLRREDCVRRQARIAFRRQLRIGRVFDDRLIDDRRFRIVHALRLCDRLTQSNTNEPGAGADGHHLIVGIGPLVFLPEAGELVGVIGRPRHKRDAWR